MTRSLVSRAASAQLRTTSTGTLVVRRRLSSCTARPSIRRHAAEEPGCVEVEEPAGAHADNERGRPAPEDRPHPLTRPAATTIAMARRGHLRMDRW